MQEMGYLGIIFLMFMDNIFPPIPSELIMPAAGFAASQGKLSLIGVIIAGSIGSLLAAAVFYWIGRLLNEARLIAWLDRYGKWLFLKSDDLRTATRWFNQHGAKIVFFGRMIPAVRSLISIPAGVSGMPFGKFMLYSSLGTIIWTSILATAGYYLGNNYQLFAEWLSNAGHIIAAVLLIGVGFALYRYFKKTKRI